MAAAEADAFGELIADRFDLVTNAIDLPEVVALLCFLELFAQLGQPPAVRRLGLRIEHLAGCADVWRADDLIGQGFFGGDSPALRERVGNLVVLPHAGESIWWYERGRFEQVFYGSHGGLLRDEMETILLAHRYG